MDYTGLMLELFQGRADAYGGDEGRAIYGTVDRVLVQAHLVGEVPIGTYCCRHVSPIVDGYDDNQMLLNMEVKWGCCDIDTGDWSEAYLLAKVLEGMGLRPWVERSRSKGWHIWIFSDDWVPAFIMRRCLKVAYSAIDLQAREANPKSEILRPNQLGNYVRMPYKGALASTDDNSSEVVVPVSRQTMMDWTKENDGEPIRLDDWLGLHTLGLITSDNRSIRRWATKWYEAPRKLDVQNLEIATGSELEGLVNRLSKPLKKLFMDGPSNKDTSQGLMALAYNVAKAGWNPQDTYKIVAAADLRFGKYHLRHDADTYYSDITERAFQ